MTDERLDYAVLISLMTREEAEVMACTLRADGIDAFLGNTNHAGINWFYLIALGGIQVMVPRAKLTEAKEAIRERIRESADFYADSRPEERVQRRDKWKLWLIFAWIYAPLILAWLEFFQIIPGEFWIWTPDIDRLIREADLRF